MIHKIPTKISCDEAYLPTNIKYEHHMDEKNVEIFPSL